MSEAPKRIGADQLLFMVAAMMQQQRKQQEKNVEVEKAEAVEENLAKVYVFPTREN